MHGLFLQLNKPGQLSFASQLHSLSQSEEQQQKVTQVTPTNASEVGGMWPGLAVLTQCFYV